MWIGADNLYGNSCGTGESCYGGGIGESVNCYESTNGSDGETIYGGGGGATNDAGTYPGSYGGNGGSGVMYFFAFICIKIYFIHQRFCFIRSFLFLFLFHIHTVLILLNLFHKYYFH